MAFAIIQNPMSRFGDTFCNTGVLAIMDYYFPGVSLKPSRGSLRQEVDMWQQHGPRRRHVALIHCSFSLRTQVPIAAKTALASLGGATWRIGLTPIDTFKTTLQVRRENRKL